MADQFNFYFRAQDLVEKMGASGVEHVVITAKIIYPSGLNVGVLSVSAQGLDGNGNLVAGSDSPGCPHPCDGTHFGTECTSQAQEVLNNYLTNNFF